MNALKAIRNKVEEARDELIEEGHNDEGEDSALTKFSSIISLIDSIFLDDKLGG